MIAVFVRPATPGQAKTRLIPALGAAGAARLYQAMAQDVIAEARRVPGHPVELWVAGAPFGPDLAFAPADLPRRAQPELGLGARMLAALRSGLARGPRAMVLGSDAPGLDAGQLARALALLDNADVVLGPAADGGFTLIAARAVRKDMFEGVRFSTRHALSDTRRACLAAGLSVALSTPWFDVDSGPDLAPLAALVGCAPWRAPRTAAALTSLGRGPFARPFDRAPLPLIPLNDRARL